MKKLLVFLSLLLGVVGSVHAAEDPFAVPNNRVGVHILNTDEVVTAAKLVNSNGGDWGYVTIPMRSNDRDVTKWLEFFRSTKELHVIPIIRISTFPIQGVWGEPTIYDLVDFANFLADMPWPTKNRYVILFNEPNHAEEWGGQVSPSAYARLLVEAKNIFKSRSQDFYLISGGLDMSVPNSTTSTEAFRFYQQMTSVQPDWYAAIDGLGVHAYPNPGFSASPFATSRVGITSFRYEENYLNGLGFESKPIFITETGSVWTNGFYNPAFTQIWTDPDIVAITPFILYAGSGDFAKFSLLSPDHKPKPAYGEITALSKTRGSPLLSNQGVPASTGYSTANKPYTAQLFGALSSVLQKFKSNFKSTKTATLGTTALEIEIADNDLKRIQGLSGRKALPVNQGMLFVFTAPSMQQFWMKDMHFALDFIWLLDNKVMEITENVLPPSQTNNQPVVLGSHVLVNQVLEVNSGFVKAHNVAIGDVLNWDQ